MCNPGAVAAGVAIVGTVFQMAGQKAETDAKAEDFEFKADMYEDTAALKLEQAQLQEEEADLSIAQSKDAERRGRISEKRHRSNVKALIGSQRAAYGASGVDVGSGIAYDVQFETGQIGEADALTIRYNTAKEAWKYSVDAWRSNQNARTLRRESDQATEAAEHYRKASKKIKDYGGFGLAGTLFSGIGQAIS